MNTLRIALFQYDIQWEDKDKNMELVYEWVSQIPEDTDLIILPEMFSTGFTMNPAPMAESRQGPTIENLEQWATEFDIAICGSMIIQENGEYKNAMFLVEEGQEVQWYDKKHLFSYGGEGHHYSPGANRVNFEFRDWRIFPFVCYDLRFPVWLRNDTAVDLYIGVANWPVARVEAWRQLLIARAIENQAYVVGVNRIGKEPSGLEYNGYSAAIDYNGIRLLEMKEEAWKVVELSKDDLTTFRGKLPFLKDRDAFEIK